LTLGKGLGVETKDPYSVLAGKNFSRAFQIA
jgi:hypothetical protein